MQFNPILLKKVLFPEALDPVINISSLVSKLFFIGFLINGLYISLKLIIFSFSNFGFEYSIVFLNDAILIKESILPINS